MPAISNGIIRFCYRHVIDASSTSAWDKLVFDSSYTEFLMQSQLYNQQKRYSSFAQLLQEVPGAEKLHFLVSSAVVGYIQQLQEQVPVIVNVLGKKCLHFSGYRFEIINSDITDKAMHQVAISFYSRPMHWHQTIGNSLLVSPVDEPATEDGLLTELIEMRPYLSIYSFKPAGI